VSLTLTLIDGYGLAFVQCRGQCGGKREDKQRWVTADASRYGAEIGSYEVANPSRCGNAAEAAGDLDIPPSQRMICLRQQEGIQVTLVGSLQMLPSQFQDYLQTLSAIVSGCYHSAYNILQLGTNLKLFSRCLDPFFAWKAGRPMCRDQTPEIVHRHIMWKLTSRLSLERKTLASFVSSLSQSARSPCHAITIPSTLSASPAG
jgi:hypothetical protein